jgi:phage protein D
MPPKTVFDLAIDGDSESWAPYVTRMEYAESLDMLNGLTVDLAFTGAALAKAVKKLLPGKPYTLTLGKRKIQGDLVRVTWSEGPDQRGRVQLFGLEQLHRVRNVRFSEVKKLKKDGVVKAVAKEAGVKVKATATTETEAELVYLDDEALGLLKRLAHERNFVITSDGKQALFQPRNQTTGSLELVWNEQVIDCRMSADIQNIATEVKVVGWDYTKNKKAEFAAKDGQLKKISGGKTGAALRKAGPGPLVITRNNWSGAAQASDVKELATGMLQRRAESFVSGRLRCHAVPDAAISAKVKVKDAPWPYGGPFVVSGVTHVMETGLDWQTTIEFFSDSLPA